MNFEKLIVTTRKGLHAVIRVFAWVAGGTLFMLVLLIISNILGRSIFKTPVSGTIELVELATVVVVYFALAYTEVRKGHVTVEELVVSRLPRGARRILAIVMYFFSAGFFIITVWQVSLLMWSYLFPSIRFTVILNIPFAPFMFVIAIGSLALSLDLLLSGFQLLLPQSRVKAEVPQ